MLYYATPNITSKPLEVSNIISAISYYFLSIFTNSQESEMMSRFDPTETSQDILLF
jgi:hypothetical protein